MKMLIAGVKVAAALGGVRPEEFGVANISVEMEELYLKQYAGAKEGKSGVLHDEDCPKGVTYQAETDPLGYDLRDIKVAMLEMSSDALSGRGEHEVQRELASVRRKLGKRWRCD